jgi:hypothetical protein
VAFIECSFGGWSLQCAERKRRLASVCIQLILCATSHRLASMSSTINSLDASFAEAREDVQGRFASIASVSHSIYQVTWHGGAPRPLVVTMHGRAARDPSCIRKWSPCQSSDVCMMSSLMMIRPLLRYLSGQRCSGHVLLKPKESLQHRLPCCSMLIGRRRAVGCEINSCNTYLLTPSRTIVFTIMCYKRKFQEQARNAGQQTHIKTSKPHWWTIHQII